MSHRVQVPSDPRNKRVSEGSVRGTHGGSRPDGRGYRRDAARIRYGTTERRALAIVFSLVCIAIAAACFMVDFNGIEDMVNAGAPEKAAWEAAFGLTITLVWLYMEILRLLSYMYGGKR